MLDRFRGSSPGRAAVLGLDGVPLSLIEDHPDRFEHLTRLFSDGSVTSLEGVVPPDTSSAWVSIMAGVNPGETGVFGLITRTTNSYETHITAAADVQAPRVWDLATAAGREATVVNVPVTYPPQRNLQRMVSGYLAPDLERAVYPDTLYETLRSLGYVLDVDATLGQEGRLEAFLDAAYETLDARFEAFAHFLDRDDWDLFTGVFMAPDRVNHFLYGQYLDGGPLREDFLAFYEQLDTYIGALRSRLGDDVTLFVVSDHGFGPLEREVEANAWLRDRGWLEFAPGEVSGLGDVDVSTRAYSLAPGRFYLNLEGREPDGAVPDAEYEVSRENLAAALRDWTGPGGAPVLEAVIPREEHFRGPHLDVAPDLVGLPADGFDLQAGFTRDGRVFRESPRTGTHRRTDAVMAIDRPDVEMDEALPYDLTPTILDVLGVEYDRATFDGASLL